MTRTEDTLHFANLGEAMRAERQNDTDRRNGAIDVPTFLRRRQSIRSGMVALLPQATPLSCFVGCVS